MTGFSSLKVGGPADAVIEPATKEDLIRLVSCLTAEGVPWQVIGRGTNILPADQGVEGVVIVLGRHFAAIQEVVGEGGSRQVQVDAGCSLTKLVRWCAGRGLSGLEFCFGIPGSVGGAIVMNAGAWGGEIAQVICEAEFLDDAGHLEHRLLTRNDFCYRGWRHPHGKVVVSGIFIVSSDEAPDIVERCHRYAKARAAKQPKGVASAGSFFKNPEGVAAGWLIEQAGLKGLRVGGAEVSQVHANFLINRGRACADDFYQLMRVVQVQVREKFGVELSPEVKLLGRWYQGGARDGKE
ncbi:MAG: UDP-N-acetylmuramate dehydrogenase [Proteobacteria bacterium]|nr:UDP-N-acetylmuramate dehydrogenase [Desulfobulbaceae bacterium]MBU4151569.1 UDP-N-acetylmuramate dehydrogenase [Pseudomonadota bacterium]